MSDITDDIELEQEGERKGGEKLESCKILEIVF